MKHFLIVFYILLIFSSCTEDDNYTENLSSSQSKFKPTLMLRKELENSISFIANRPILKGGKIYLFDSKIFITEPYKGVHIIDNSNPSSPNTLGFIRVPGCMDVAVKDNIMFVDNATDLVEIDISNPINPTVLSRSRNIFPDLVNPDGIVPWEYSIQNRPSNTVIIGWE